MLIVLAGNPNAGKSALFGRLTGRYAEVSNYPGTTVDIMSCRAGGDIVVDAPGAYSLSGESEDERVARDMIGRADMVVNVVNATSLERDLFLTTQLVETGVPMVLALNMMDEAHRQGLTVDVAGLARALGVPVVPTVAASGAGVDRLRSGIPRARAGRLDGWTGHAAPGTGDEMAASARRQWVDSVADRCVFRRLLPPRVRDILGDLLVTPLPGGLVLAAVVGGLYWFLGVVVAGRVVEITEGWLMGRLLLPLVTGLIDPALGRWPLARELLSGEYGILTVGAAYLIGLILPLVTAFYLALAVLEDSGYLPRMAVLADRVLGTVGLGGRAVIPFTLGLGCVTMALMSTRILHPRERRIACVLLSLAVPCSAQMAIISAMLVPMGPGPVLTYLATLAVVFLVTGRILATLLPGRSPGLFIDLPPLRVPAVSNVLLKTTARTGAFLKEASPLFVAGSALLGLLSWWGAVDPAAAALEPVMVGWLRLPAGAAMAFVMGFIRRDFGAAGLHRLPLSPSQAVTGMVTMTLFVPCLASVLILSKERGWKEGMLVWWGTMAVAVLTGGLVSRLLAATG